MKEILIVLSLFFLSSIMAAGGDLDSILIVLDKTVKERHLYVLDREKRIELLMNKINQSTTDENRFKLYGNLFNEYKKIHLTSALDVANKRINIAKKLKNKDFDNEAMLNLAEIMVGLGMNHEVHLVLSDFKISSLSKTQKIYYFHICHSLNILNEKNALTEERKSYYNKLIFQYKDSLLENVSPLEPSYILIKSGKQLMEGKAKEVITSISEVIGAKETNERTLAHAAFLLSEAYNSLGDDFLQKKFLAISAIADLHSGTKEYISLGKLGHLLFKTGDISRAYEYTKCSMEDAIQCNARHRALEFSEMLPIIISSYDTKMNSEKENLSKALLLALLLFCILVIALIYIYLQLKKLSKARELIHQINQDLNSTNNDLKKLNNKLSEANIIKEEYIGFVFNLCIQYIDNIENYRININKKLRTGKAAEALKVTESGNLAIDELNDFFANFDLVFLNIFPNFIFQFNNFLKKDEQIVIKKEGTLTPELRVFALIRLGIVDSDKIAKFLHYSVQTVYNYKLKIRSKLLISKEEFNLAIHEIGN